MHLNAAGHEGAAVFAHVARSDQMHLDTVILNWKQPKTLKLLFVTLVSAEVLSYAEAKYVWFLDACKILSVRVFGFTFQIVKIPASK